MTSKTTIKTSLLVLTVISIASITGVNSAFTEELSNQDREKIGELMFNIITMTSQNQQLEAMQDVPEIANVIDANNKAIQVLQQQIVDLTPKRDVTPLDPQFKAKVDVASRTLVLEGIPIMGTSLDRDNNIFRITIDSNKEKGNIDDKVKSLMPKGLKVEISYYDKYGTLQGACAGSGSGFCNPVVVGSDSTSFFQDTTHSAGIGQSYNNPKDPWHYSIQYSVTNII